MEKKGEKRRILLVPLTLHGHITPILQLGKALSLNGFSVTVFQGQFNRVNTSWPHYSGFQFLDLPESLPESELKRLSPVEFQMKQNKMMESNFKTCIGRLLLQQGNDIACIIYDEFMSFCGATAEEYKLPSFIFTATSAANKACQVFLSKVNAKKFMMDMEDPEVQDTVVEALHPIRYRDLPTSGFGPLESFLENCRVVNKRTGSGIILNTASCLESSSLSWMQRELGIPLYVLGPLHASAKEVKSSVLEEDRGCIDWLNKQKPSNQPFLWVIRPGSIVGSGSGIESLPEEVSKKASERGYIAKWAPQNEVLGHPAVGGFWSHCGWNSILESIEAGVPIICKPFQGEQKLNAMYLESVWRIGFQIGGQVERGEVERAVKRLIVDEEGASMRRRVLDLKEKIKASVRSGGSSYEALDKLVKNLKAENVEAVLEQRIV
ncbi:hypothetical protein Bca4012_017707 [Brassica carinata]